MNHCAGLRDFLRLCILAPCGDDGAVKNRRIGGYLLCGVPCAHLLNRSLCVPVLANVRTRTSSSMRA